MCSNYAAAAERIPKEEYSEDARLAAAIVTAMNAHSLNGEPKACRHIRRTLTDEDGVTVQTTCLSLTL